MRGTMAGAIAIKSFALLVVLGTARQAIAQDAATPYPKWPRSSSISSTERRRSHWREVRRRSPYPRRDDPGAGTAGL